MASCDMGATGFFILGCMPFSSILSPLPASSAGEALAWFRFPLFAMAVTFWLGRDRRLINAMLLSVGLGMLVIVCYPCS